MNHSKIEARKKWIEALRSGKYEQGKDRLRVGNRFCCLGVAVDLFDSKKWYHSDLCYTGYIEALALPEIVRKAYGLTDHLGSFEFNSLPKTIQEKIEKTGREALAKRLAALPGNKYDLYAQRPNLDSLVNMNDDGVPFDIIADVIEAEPKGLFSD